MLIGGGIFIGVIASSLIGETAETTGGGGGEGDFGGTGTGDTARGGGFLTVSTTFCRVGEAVCGLTGCSVFAKIITRKTWWYPYRTELTFTCTLRYLRRFDCTLLRQRLLG